LVLVLEKGETFGLAGFFVAHEVKVSGFAELREDSDDVAFGQVERETADKDEGCAAIVGVP